MFIRPRIRRVAVVVGLMSLSPMIGLNPGSSGMRAAIAQTTPPTPLLPPQREA